jgi:hypothetical protein
MAKGRPSVTSSLHFIGAHCALLALVLALAVWRFLVAGKPLSSCGSASFSVAHDAFSLSFLGVSRLV